MTNLVKRAARFETHHKIFVFMVLIIGTIAFVRLGAKVYDPDPMFFSLELHHFDYGLLVLLVTVNLLLFSSRKYLNLYLIMAAISTGLIIDDYVFMRQGLVEGAKATQVYQSSLGYVLVFVVAISLISLFISSFLNSRKNN